MQSVPADPPPARVGAPTFRIITDALMILEGDYHPDQLWLGFMAGVILPQSTEDRAALPRQRCATTPPDFAKLLRDRLAQPRMRIPKGCRRLVVTNSGVCQFILPFHEARSFNGRSYAHWSMMGLPGWDRTQSGKPCRIGFPRAREGAVRLWCAEQCRGQYFVAHDYAVFQDINEAVAAKFFHHARETA